METDGPNHAKEKQGKKTKEGPGSNIIITGNDNAFKLKAIFDTQNPEG